LVTIVWVYGEGGWLAVPRGSKRLDEYLRQLSGMVRGGAVSLDEVIRRVVEEAVAEAASRASGSAGVQELGPLVARLERIEESLRRLEEELAGLRREIRDIAQRGSGLSRRDIEELARAIAAAVAVSREQGQGRREPKWLRLLAERLREKGGLVLLEELPPELRQEVDLGALEARGYVVASLAGRRVIATREAVREFGEKLRSLKASDEYEAEAALGRYGVLFRLLRSEGLVYYAGPSRGWVLENKARVLLGL